MRTLDFSPLFRHSVGFDRMQGLLDAASRTDSATTAYPPYNIESQGENTYRISMAVAGFSADEIDVTTRENTVVITGKASDVNEDVEYLHRGIAKRAFERRFDLADTIKVTGGNLHNGILHVNLVREVPEEQKPRRIEIATSPAVRGLESVEAPKAA